MFYHCGNCGAGERRHQLLVITMTIFMLGELYWWLDICQTRIDQDHQKQDLEICIHWRGLESNSCLELQGLTIDQDSSSPVRGSYYEETNFSTQVLTQN